MSIAVFIEPVSGHPERFMMEVDESAPVSELISELSARLELPAESIRLVYYGTRLSARKSLQAQDVLKEGVIHVVEAKPGAAEPVEDISIVLKRSAGRTETITLAEDATVRDLYVHVAKLWKIEPNRLRFTLPGGKRLGHRWESRLSKEGVKPKGEVTVTMLLPDDPDGVPVPGFVLRVHPEASPVEVRPPGATGASVPADEGVLPPTMTVTVTDAGMVPQPKGGPVAHYMVTLNRDGSVQRSRVRFSRVARMDTALRAELPGPAAAFPPFPHLGPFSRLWQCMGCGLWVSPVEDLRRERARALNEYFQGILAAHPRVATSDAFGALFLAIE